MIESFMLGGAIVIGISVTVTAVLLVTFEIQERWNKYKR